MVHGSFPNLPELPLLLIWGHVWFFFFPPFNSSLLSEIAWLFPSLYCPHLTQFQSHPPQFGLSDGLSWKMSYSSSLELDYSPASSELPVSSIPLRLSPVVSSGSLRAPFFGPSNALLLPAISSRAGPDTAHRPRVRLMLCFWLLVLRGPGLTLWHLVLP